MKHNTSGLSDNQVCVCVSFPETTLHFQILTRFGSCFLALVLV